MAKRVQQDDIITINTLYLQHKTYAEVARRTGFSPSTVKKYIIDGYVPEAEKEIIKFDKELIQPIRIIQKMFEEVGDNWGVLCELSEAEQDEIKELQKELNL